MCDRFVDLAAVDAVIATVRGKPGAIFFTNQFRSVLQKKLLLRLSATSNGVLTLSDFRVRGGASNTPSKSCKNAQELLDALTSMEACCQCVVNGFLVYDAINYPSSEDELLRVQKAVIAARITPK